MAVNGVARGQSYIGVNAPTPPNLLVQERNPTIKDINAALGTIWLNVVSNSVFMLTNINNMVATWTPLASSTTLTKLLGDNAQTATEDGMGSIRVAGGINITTAGDNANTLTINANGTFDPDNINLPDTDGLLNVGFINYGPDTFPGAHDNRFVTDSGVNNTFVGKKSGNINSTAFPISTAQDNAALGSAALTNIQTGSRNTGIGSQSLPGLSSGEDNTFVGALSAEALLTGSRNTGIGSEVFYDTIDDDGLQTGNQNIGIGFQAGSAYRGAESSNILISHTGFLGESNKIRIGSFGMTAGLQNEFYVDNMATVTANKTYYGNGAGNIASTGIDNVAIGRLAGSVLTTGTSNVAVGREAGRSITSSNGTVCIGYNAGMNISDSGDFNICIGYEAGRDMDDGGERNILIGAHAGFLINGGVASENVGIGYNVFYDDTGPSGMETGTQNIAIGFEAAKNFQGGESGNIIIGNPAFGGIDFQIRIGTVGIINDCYIAGIHDAVGLDPVTTVPVVIDATGKLGPGTGIIPTDILALPDTDTAVPEGLITFGPETVVGSFNNRFVSDRGTNNTFIGKNSGNVNVSTVPPVITSASNNVAVGSSAGSSLTTGIKNTFVGSQSGILAQESISNTGVGNGTLTKIVGPGATFNVAVGDDAGGELTSGSSNTYVGTSAGTLATTGIGNTALGFLALGFLLDGEANIAIGPEAGSAYDGAQSNNIVIGNIGDMGDNNTIVIGTYGVAPGQQNKFFVDGMAAVFSANTSLGSLALLNGTTTSVNTVAIGAAAGRDITTAEDNICIGVNAGISLTTTPDADGNLIVGTGAALAMATGSNNVLMGTSAATVLNANAAQKNVGVGASVFSKAGPTGLVSGANNIAMGALAASEFTTNESNNIIIGHVGVVGDGSGANPAVIRIGTSAVQTACFIQGIHSAAGLDPLTTVPVVIDASGKLGPGGGVIPTDILALPDTDTNIPEGLITFGPAIANFGNRFVTNAGTNNTFLGKGSGNVQTGANPITTASNNVAVGSSAGSSLISGSNSVFVGNNAGTLIRTGQNNVAIGSGAMAATSIGTTQNVTVGRLAGNKLQNTDNVLIGDQAGVNITNGISNVGLGSAVLSNLVTGDNNIAIGVQAGLSYTGAESSNILLGNVGTMGDNNVMMLGTDGNAAGQQDTTFIAGTVNVARNLNVPTTTATVGSFTINSTRVLHTFGTRNIFAGSAAGNYTLTGNASQNVFIGFNAGNALVGTAGIQGSSNALVGAFAGVALSEGNSNTGIGDTVLQLLTTGSNNIAVGRVAGSVYSTESNNIAVGHVGVGADAGVIRIGTLATQTKCFIQGISGVITGGAAVAVLVDANGQLGTTSSTRRVKDEIVDLPESYDDILKLRTVEFEFKKQRGHKQVGLIAEEVNDIMPWLVIYDDEGLPQTVRYHDLVPLLLAQIQKQGKLIEQLQNKVSKLESLLS